MLRTWEKLSIELDVACEKAYVALRRRSNRRPPHVDTCQVQLVTWGHDRLVGGSRWLRSAWVLSTAQVDARFLRDLRRWQDFISFVGQKLLLRHSDSDIHRFLLDWLLVLALVLIAERAALLNIKRRLVWILRLFLEWLRVEFESMGRQLFLRGVRKRLTLWEAFELFLLVLETQARDLDLVGAMLAAVVHESIILLAIWASSAVDHYVRRFDFPLILCIWLCSSEQTSLLDHCKYVIANIILITMWQFLPWTSSHRLVLIWFALQFLLKPLFRVIIDIKCCVGCHHIKMQWWWK